MPGTEIAKGNGGTASRPLDPFSAMRHEKDRLFARFERALRAWLAELAAGAGTCIRERHDA